MKPPVPAEAAQRHGERDIVYAGPSDRQAVSLGSMQLLRQIRGTYEDEPMDELVRTIDSGDPNNPFDLKNPPEVGMFDRKHARDFIRDANAFWGTKMTLRGAKVDPETGMYVIVISGHRRTRAVGMIAKKYGIEPDNVRIRVTPYHNIRFADALMKQLQENTYHPVALDEEAYAIKRIFDLQRAANPGLTQEAFAAIIRKKPSKVANALLFCDLPEDVRGYVENGQINFGLAVSLARAQREYVHRYARWSKQGRIADEDKHLTAEQWAAGRTTNLAIDMLRRREQDRRRGSAYLGRFVTGTLRTMRAERRLGDRTFELETPEASIAHDRARLVLELAQISLANVGVAVKFDPDVIARVVERDATLLPVADLVKKAIELAQPAEVIHIRRGRRAA